MDYIWLIRDSLFANNAIYFQFSIFVGFFFCKTRHATPTVRNSLQSLLCPFCYSSCRFSSRAHSTLHCCAPQGVPAKLCLGMWAVELLPSLNQTNLPQALLCELPTSKRNAHLHPSSRQRCTCRGRGLILTAHIHRVTLLFCFALGSPIQFLLQNRLAHTKTQIEKWCYTLEAVETVVAMYQFAWFLGATGSFQ